MSRSKLKRFSHMRQEKEESSAWTLDARGAHDAPDIQIFKDALQVAAKHYRDFRAA